MGRLLGAGYACAWIRYRTEVGAGIRPGGRLVRDVRQGRELFNRSPLEYEDEIAVVEYLKTLPFLDADRVGLIGMSRGGEMVLKITSEHDGVAVAVASEPAPRVPGVGHPTTPPSPTTGMRNIEEMQMAETDKVRARIDTAKATDRIATINTPILVMGCDDDHLQGIFRTTYELLAEEGKDVEWVTWDHPLHGYIFPVRGADGGYEVNGVQEAAITGAVAYLDRYLN